MTINWKNIIIGSMILITSYNYNTALAQCTVGDPLPSWQEGQLQVHFIYTGVAESTFYIFPDGTSMLLDCGDKDALARGELAVPVLPNADRHSGEWVARYVMRVNPRKDSVDYLMLSHYHADHGGTPSFHAGMKNTRYGKLYLSGLSHVSEFISFSHIIDRDYPRYCEPELLTNSHGNLKHVKTFYQYMKNEKGTDIQKFVVGAKDQISMKNNASKYPSFHIYNICGNGYVSDKQGNVREVYKKYVGRNEKINENAMSTGFIMEYGGFNLYTAGDFCGGRTLDDGTKLKIEDALADVVSEVNVAKVNHHGYKTMTPKLIKALSPQVFVSCVWDQLHNHRSTLARLSDRSIYPEPRLICPTIYPIERYKKEKTERWINDIPEPALNGGHVVVTVEPDGKVYTLCYVSAADEQMTVKYVQNFQTTR